MTTTLWKSGGWGGNGTNTITSPNNLATANAGQATDPQKLGIVQDIASPALPSGAKVYWEITVNGGNSLGGNNFTYTAFILGIQNGILSNPNNFQTGNDSTGAGVAFPSGTIYGINFSYNHSVTVYNSNGGYVVARVAGSPAPSFWHNGDVIGFAYDGIAKTIQFYQNGAAVWGAFNVSGLGSVPLYISAETWSGGKPVAKLNDGTTAFAHSPPSGFVSLQSANSGGSSPPVTNPGLTAINVTVVPNPVIANSPYQIVGQAVGHAFSGVGNILYSSQISPTVTYVAAPDQFEPNAKASLSTDGMTVTISGITSGSQVPHIAYVQDAGYGVSSSGVTYNVNAPSTGGGAVTVGVSTSAFKFSPGFWYGNSGRGGTTYRVTACDTDWFDFTWTASATPTLSFTMSSDVAGMLVDWRLNGVLTQGKALTSTITGIVPSATNTIRVYFGTNNGTYTHWTVTNAILDSGSSAGSAPATQAWGYVIGDEISEPIGVESTNSWVYLLQGRLPSNDISNQSLTGSGWLVTGEGGTWTAYYPSSGTQRWNTIDDPSGTPISLLDSASKISSYGSTGTTPAFINIVLGGEDCIKSASTSTLTTQITAAITALRAATSSTCKILITIPFGLYSTSIYANGPTYVAAIKAGFTAYQTAAPSDTQVFLIDGGAALSTALLTGGRLQSDGLNLSAAGHAYVDSIIGPMTVAALSSSTSSPTTTIASNNAAFKYSSTNWTGTARSGGSGNPTTCKIGAWFSVTWNASNAPSAVLNISGGASNTGFVSIYLNNTLIGDRCALGALTVPSASIVKNAANTLLVYYSGYSTGTVWNAGANTLTVTSLVVDNASTAGTAATANPYIMLIGDGILTGYETDFSVPNGPNPAAISAGQNFLKAYGYLLDNALTAYDVVADAAVGSGWITAGGPSGDVPAYYYVSGGTYNSSLSRWNLVNNGVSVLDGSSHISGSGGTSQQPYAIFVCLGTADALASKSTSDLTASVTQWLVAARAAAPSAVLGVVVPFGFYDSAVYPSAYLTALKLGVTNYQTAHSGDTAAYLIDLGSATSNTLETTTGIPANVTGISAYASISSVLSGSTWTHTLNVTNNGSVNIETFWFAWAPGLNFLPSLPTPSNPSGWTNTVTGSTGAYGIQWVTTTTPLTPGNVKTFSFTSADSPKVLLSTSVANPPNIVATSYVYTGAPQVGTPAIFVPATNLPGAYINPDLVYPTTAGQAFVTPILNNAITAPLGPQVPVTTGGGLPYYGWGCQLGYANQSGSVASNFSWFTKYFCVPRSMLYYASNFYYASGQNSYVTLYGASLWANDPNLNGTNTGKKCIPIQGCTSATLDGVLNWADISAGKCDTYITGTLSPWTQRSWPIVFQRWAYEDNYPTTPAGQGAYAGSGGSYPATLKNGKTASAKTPWTIYGVSGWSAAHISQWRYASHLSKTFAAQNSLKLYMCWGPTHISSGQNGSHPFTWYPDNNTSDGLGSLVDAIAPDWYCTGFYGPTAQSLFTGYQNQQPYTAFTGTVKSDPSGPSDTTWTSDTGTLYYAMDYLAGRLNTMPPTTTNHTGGYTSQETLGWALAKSKPWTVPEFGAYNGPGTVYTTNNLWQASNGTAPWLGAYIRSRLNWFGSVSSNGIANGTCLQMSFWQNQSIATLQGMAQAYPEFVGNPDAGLTASGGPVAKAVYISQIPSVTLGQPVVVTFITTYTPVLSNYNYNAGTGGSDQSLPANAVASTTANSVTFSFTSTVPGSSFQMVIKDTVNNIQAVPQTYAVLLPKPAGASIVIPSIPTQTTGQAFSVQIAFNGYVPNQANVQASHGTSASFQPQAYMNSNWSAVWSDGGQLLTLTFKDGISSDHVTQVQDVSFAQPLMSNVVTNSYGSGGGGLITSPAPVPASTSSVITISSPGTIQEASPGAGVTPTLTIIAQNIPNNQVFYGVFNSSNSLVGSYSSAVSVSSGSATISPFLALSGYYVKVVDNVSSPTVTAQSDPVTIIDSGNVTPTISISAPGNLTVASGATSASTNVTITTTNLSTIWWGVYSSSNVLRAPLVSVSTSGSVTVQATFLATGDYVGAQNTQTSPTTTAKSSIVTLTASAATPTLSITSPGTIVEPSSASSVNATLTVASANLVGPVYWSVLSQQGGNVVSGPTSLALDAHGSASLTANFTATGQVVYVASDTTAKPAVSVTSQPVIVSKVVGNTVVQTVSLSAPGIIQEASSGVDVSPTITANTVNLAGGLSVRVRKSDHTQETSYVTYAPNGAAITLPTTIPNQAVGKAFSLQIGFNYVPIQTNISIGININGTGMTFYSMATIVSTQGATVAWDGTGQLLTITNAFGYQGSFAIQMKDTTFTTPLLSSTVSFSVGSSGGGGTVSVPAPTPAPSPQSFTFTQLMLHDQDYLQGTASLQPITGIAGSASITYSGSGTITYTITLANNGTVPIGTFIFGSTPGFNLLPTAPTPSNPTGWTNTVTTSGGGSSIAWTTSTNQIAAGSTGTFTFTSTDATTVMFGQSTVSPGNVVCTFTTYTGAALATAGFVAAATDNTIQGITGFSSPVTIYDSGSGTKMLAISAPGTIQETALGVGVTPTLTITSNNLTGNLFYEVLTATNAVESGYVSVTIPAGWTSVVSDNFTRANTSTGGAGTTTGAGNNWTDQNGGVWNINSNQLVGTVSTHSIVAWLTRPSGEAATNSRITGSFVYNSTVMSEAALGLRMQVGTITQSYLARLLPSDNGAVNPVITIYSYNNTGTQLAVSGNLTLTNGTYTLDFSAVGTNPTALTLTLFDSSGAQVSQITATDSTSFLQGPGMQYLLTWAQPSTTQAIHWTQATTYTGSGNAFTISPHLANTGDYVKMVDNTTSPTITAISAPVVITDFNSSTAGTPTITATAINIAIAPSGTNYQCLVQIATTNITSGSVQLEVLTPNGSVETPYVTVALKGDGTANQVVFFQNSGDSIQVVDQQPNPNAIASTGALPAPQITPAAITVNQPSPLFVGIQGITGFWSTNGTAPSAIYLAFQVNQPTSVIDPGVVQATLLPNNQFSATLAITGGGLGQTLWYTTDGQTWSGAWTASPFNQNVQFSTNALPTPFLPGPLSVGGTLGSGGSALQVVLQATQLGAPSVGASNAVNATILGQLWSATVVAGQVGVPETLWYSLNGAAYVSTGVTGTPIGAIIIDQPAPQYVAVTYNVVVDFNYIINIPTGGPIPSTLVYSKTGAAPYTLMQNSPIAPTITTNALGNTRIIMNLQESVVGTVSLVVVDNAAPGGGSASSPIVTYPVTIQPTVTGSPFILAYQPAAQQATVAWTGIADFNYAVGSLSTIGVQYLPAGGFVSATSLTSPQGAVIQPNPNVSGGSRIVFTLVNPTAGLVEFQVQDTSPPGGGGTIVSPQQPFTVLTSPPPTTPTTQDYRTVWGDGSTFDIVKAKGVPLVSAGFVGGGPTTATSIGVWTPAYTQPNTSVTLTGTFVGGPPVSLDYTINNGVSWITAATSSTTINASNFTWSINIPAGVSAGTYPANNSVSVRDTNNHNAVGNIPGKWLVNSFSPAAPSSGQLIFGSAVANPAFTQTDNLGHVVKLLDIGGSQRFLTVGPTTPPNNPAGSVFSGANPVLLNRGVGQDGGQTGLGMTCTTNSIVFDNNANYFGAGLLGANGGLNDALITMLNTSSINSNNWCVVFGCYLDVTKIYQGGPIWGWWPSSTTGSFITAGRWNGHNTGPFTTEVDTAGSGGALWAPNQTTLSSSGYHVFTAQQIGSTLRYSIDGGPYVSTTIGGTDPFSATTFSYGGSIIQNIGNINSGNAYSQLFDFYAFTGVPSASDITNAQNAIGSGLGR